MPASRAGRCKALRCRSGARGVQRRTNISISDVEDLGVAKVVEMALERAWDGCDAVYLSFDIDSIAGFVPGTGWPEPGGLMPREALKMVGLIAAEGLCGMELVEVSPPYDHADITSLMALRLCVDVLARLARRALRDGRAQADHRQARSCRSERRCRLLRDRLRRAAARAFSYGQWRTASSRRRRRSGPRACWRTCEPPALARGGCVLWCPVDSRGEWDTEVGRFRRCPRLGRLLTR